MAKIFAEPAERERSLSLMQGLAADASVRDAEAFLDFLNEREEVVAGPMATVGYCMGGRISLAVAGHHPDRVAAAASIRGALRIDVRLHPMVPLRSCSGGAGSL
jgi:carboxymethylenebutenolidase